MTFSSYNYNYDVYTNFKSNLLADRMAKNRWGNKFKELFSRHAEVIYESFPSYNFKEGMKDCTNVEGTTADRLQETQDYRASLDNIAEQDGVFVLIVRNTSIYDEIDVLYDVYIDSGIYRTDDNDTVLDEYDSELVGSLREQILEQNLFNFSLSVGSTMEIQISLLAHQSYIDEEIVELQNYSIDHIRMEDDLELINHLGLCSTLASEIDRPHKIKKIWFRMRKKVSPPAIYDGGVMIGYDPNYEWWNESQFDEIRAKVKDFHTHCVFVVGEVDDNGAYSSSYVYAHAGFLYQAGWQIYWFVKAFLDIGITVKRNWFQQLFGVLVLVVGIYLSAISSNPAWMKIALIVGAVASYSGAMSSEMQLALMVVMFAYGAYNTELSAMSNTQMFSWAINNIEMVFKMVQQYKTIKNEPKTDKNDEKVYETQERAMNFIYSDAYSQYDNLYNVVYDYEPKYI